MSTSLIIRKNAHIQAQILASIDELNYVPPALHLHMGYFDEVHALHSESQSRLLSLSAISKEKHRKLIKIQKSSTQRLAYKLVGKKRTFAEKELKRKR
ncbi:hypothetical protein BDZ94DRAFT_1170897 [Collybia nuda]|uniref:Uncharacterized protein n=1 Tax=Collybia nuda TaxID=64659 RepID=A0A9P5Y1S1_9AGAR|nr:hypothetical protein BDZ94DRAFT_1170897 [Collybia nuda]